MDSPDKTTVLFASGCEWMVCKRDTEMVMNGTRVVHHIYLREVSLGLNPGKTTLLWLDDQVRTYTHWIAWKMMRKAEMQADPLVDLRIILKNNTETTRSYMLSTFFRLSLSIGKCFKFLQTCHRQSENKIKTFNFDKGEYYQDIPCQYAGAAFLQDIWPHYLACMSNNMNIELAMFSGTNEQIDLENKVMFNVRKFLEIQKA